MKWLGYTWEIKILEVGGAESALGRGRTSMGSALDILGK
jgi:hypothetical protein